MKTIEIARFGGKLANIYKRQYGKCYEYGCTIAGIHNLTRDHEIPIAVAKLYGWSRAVYDAEDNIKLRCPPHHIQKDRLNNQRIGKIKKRQEILNRIRKLKYELTGAVQDRESKTRCSYCKAVTKR